MIDLVDRLGEFGILAELDRAELAAVAGVSRVEDFAAGATLTEEGAEADHLYLFLKGKATVMVSYPDGGSGVLDEVSAGDELGWSAVTKPYRYTATARATEPVQAIVIDGADLRRLAEQNHHLGYGIAQGAIAIVARRYGRAIGGHQDLREKDLRAFRGEERVVWDNGSIQLTTEAVLFDAHTDFPDVVPLEGINEVAVEDGCIVPSHGRGCPLVASGCPGGVGGAHPGRGSEDAPRLSAGGALDRAGERRLPWSTFRSA